MVIVSVGMVRVKRVDPISLIFLAPGHVAMTTSMHGAVRLDRGHAMEVSNRKAGIATMTSLVLALMTPTMSPKSRHNQTPKSNMQWLGIFTNVASHQLEPIVVGHLALQCLGPRRKRSLGATR